MYKMQRYLFWVAALGLLITVHQSKAQSVGSSNPSAMSLAQKSLAALAGRGTIADVTLTANVVWIVGSNNQTGTAVLQAKGTTESNVNLSLSRDMRSEVRALVNGYPSGSWRGKATTAALVPQHNCWTDAAWFFPALSSLTQIANPKFLFKYIGQEQHGGVNAQHIQISQIADGVAAVQKMSTMDFYLDPSSLLPLAIAFQVHPDADAGTNIPAEVRFSDYRLIDGVQVPFHVVRMLNGGVVLDITMTNVAFNSGLPDSMFSIQ